MSDDTGNQYVEMPAGRLTFPTSPEEAFPMRHEDWQRIRDRLDSVSPPTQTYSAVAWAVLGIAVGAALALATWLPARSVLPAQDWAWVTPTLSVVAVAGFLVMAVCFFAQRTVNTQQSESVSNIVTDMDRVYSPHGGPRIRDVPTVPTVE